MRIYKKSGAGFTLIEALVVIALTVVIMAVGAQIFLSNNSFYQTQVGLSSANNAAREAADRIEEYGRGANTVVGSRVYGGTTYTSGAETVVFELPSVDASDNIVPGAYDYVIIAKDPVETNKLKLIVDADSASARLNRELLLSDKLTLFDITYNNVDPVQASSLTFQITITEPGRHTAVQPVYGRVTFRN